MRDTENEPREDRREAGRRAEENELQTDGEEKKGKLTNLADDTCLVSSRGLNAKRSSGNMTDWIRNIYNCSNIWPVSVHETKIHVISTEGWKSRQRTERDRKIFETERHRQHVYRERNRVRSYLSRRLWSACVLDREKSK